MVLRLSRVGARVVSLRVPVDGELREVTCGIEGDDAFLSSGHFFGGSIGRYANRIAGGHLPLDGVDHVLATQPTGHTLHGGPEGFDKRAWDVAEVSQRHAVLTLDSPDGDQGFPGRVRAAVRYAVGADGVDITYTATTDAPTVVCLTNHTYLTLAGVDDGDVRDHQLQVAASRYTPVDAELIPTGELASVEGTPFDLLSPTLLREVVTADQPGIDAGLDHNFVLDDGGAPQIRLIGPRGDLALDITTDQPGVQVYTGQGLDRDHPPYAGIALEPQVFPDSPHHPEWPSPVLRPTEEYRTTTSWKFLAG